MEPSWGSLVMPSAWGSRSAPGWSRRSRPLRARRRETAPRRCGGGCFPWRVKVLRGFVGGDLFWTIRWCWLMIGDYILNKIISIDNVDGHPLMYSVTFFGQSVDVLVGGLVAINLAFSQKYWECLIIPIDELLFFRGVAQPPASVGWWLEIIYLRVIIIIPECQSPMKMSQSLWKLSGYSRQYHTFLWYHPNSTAQVGFHWISWNWVGFHGM